MITGDSPFTEFIEFLESIDSCQEGIDYCQKFARWKVDDVFIELETNHDPTLAPKWAGYVTEGMTLELPEVQESWQRALIGYMGGCKPVVFNRFYSNIFPNVSRTLQGMLNDQRDISQGDAAELAERPLEEWCEVQHSTIVRGPGALPSRYRGLTDEELLTHNFYRVWKIYPKLQPARNMHLERVSIAAAETRCEEICEWVPD